MLEIAENDPRLYQRLHPAYPYIKAEVIYAARNEYALTVADVLSRRMRLSYQDVEAALTAGPWVADCLASELGWTNQQKNRYLKEFQRECLEEFGGSLILDRQDR